MGATLPVLSRAVVLSPGDFLFLGRRVALLYAVNTAGAVLGAVGSGLWLLPALGLSRSHMLSVVAILVVAVLAMALAKQRSAVPDLATPPAARPAKERERKGRRESLPVVAAASRFDAWMVLVAFALSGAVAMTLEVLLSRALGLVVGSATQSLAIVLGVFLLGLSRGAATNADPLGWLAVVFVAAAVVWSFLRLDELPRVFFNAARRSASPAGVGFQVRALVAATIAPVTFFLGAIVLASRSANRWRRWGTTAVAAALLPPIWLLPDTDRKVLGGGPFGAVQRGWSKLKAMIDERTLLYYRDGISSTATVFEAPNGVRTLRTNGKADGSTGADQATQKLLGMLPAVLHPNAQGSAFVIGYGTGMTVGALTQAPNVTGIDVVDIEEAVFAVADEFFSPWTHAPEQSPRVRRFVGDGRNVLLARGGVYDIIVSEPPNPWMAGVANLFTVQFYEAAKEHLAADGVFCQWVQLYEMRSPTLKLVYRTFQKSFPHVLVFNVGDVDSILIGTRDPLRLDLDLLERRLGIPAVRAEVAGTSFETPASLLSRIALTPAELARCTGTGSINTDDTGLLEFAAQRDFYYAVSDVTRSTAVYRTVRQELTPRAALETLDIDLGQGPSRARRAAEIAQVLTQAGRRDQAEVWLAEARASGS